MSSNASFNCNKVAKYVSKPIEVYALQFHGDNESEVVAFISSINKSSYLGTFYIDKSGLVKDKELKCDGDRLCIKLKTLEGNTFATIGDYIVCGTENELYPVKSSIFVHKYMLSR